MINFLKSLLSTAAGATSLFSMPLKISLFLNGLAVVVIITLVNLYDLEINHVKKERDQAFERVGSLSSQINDQNAAINQWKQQADTTNKRINLATKQAVQSFDDAQKDISRIAGPKGNTCEDSIKWGIEQAQELSK